MKALINRSTMTFIGKLKEEDKMVSIISIMSKEINTLTYLEHFGNKSNHELVEITLCYDSNEATVQTMKESYAYAKQQLNT